MIFDELIEQENVHLVLSKYNLESVPPEIGQLKKVKSLFISKHEPNGWITKPPLSAKMDQLNNNKSVYTLPKEITQLNNLTQLIISDLDLETLPDNMNNLTQLEHLDISLNFLNIPEELNKLQGMRSLSYINFLRNFIDKPKLGEWARNNPHFKIQKWDESGIASGIMEFKVEYNLKK